MGNTNGVGLKLDKAHRSCCIGRSDLNGSIELEGGKEYESLARSTRIGGAMRTPKQFTKDVLHANAVSAMCTDILGFRLEFLIVGKLSLLWTIPGMNYVKVTQIFPNESAPPKITSVRGFYLVYIMLKDMWDLHALSARSDIEDTIELDDENECPLCMDRGIEIVPSCGHGVCKLCYQQWIAIDPTCPSCRLPSDSKNSWVIPGVEYSSDMDLHKTSLLQSIHLFVQSLPRLETKTERKEREKNLKVVKRNSSSNEEVWHDSLSPPLSNSDTDTCRNGSSFDHDLELALALSLSIH